MREPGEFVLADGVLGRVIENSVTRRRHECRLRGAPVVGDQLQTRLERPADGWVKPRRQLLDQIELPHSIRDVIARLERAGLIEVQRRPNKRALVRLL